MTESHFKVTYSITDDYFGKLIPSQFSIYYEDLEDDMDDEDLSNFFYESLDNHFKQRVWAESDDLNAFIEWARQKLSTHIEENYGND